MPLKGVFVIKIRRKNKKNGLVVFKRDGWRDDYIFSGQWDQWLKRGTVPLKTGRLVTLD
jgi:hypothetical protein